MTEQTNRERYLRAYYHVFTSTGNDAIDAILEALARAGKSYHSTDEWDNEADEGATHWEAIQRAADQASRTLEAALKEKDAEIARLRRDDLCQCRECGRPEVAAILKEKDAEIEAYKSEAASHRDALKVLADKIGEKDAGIERLKAQLRGKTFPSLRGPVVNAYRCQCGIPTPSTAAGTCSRCGGQT